MISAYSSSAHSALDRTLGAVRDGDEINTVYPLKLMINKTGGMDSVINTTVHTLHVYLQYTTHAWPWNLVTILGRDYHSVKVLNN